MQRELHARTDQGRIHTSVSSSIAADRVVLLTFALGDFRLALPVARVVEIHRAVALVRVPDAPDIVEGAIHYRGVVVPVLDVRARFGVVPAPLDPEQHLIVARARRRIVALRVDRALDIVEVPPEAIRSGEDAVAGPRVLGIARLPEGLLVIQDLDRFLSLDEEVALVRALSGTGSASGSVQGAS